MPEGTRLAGKTRIITATPVITASQAYAAGNLIGNAALSFAAGAEAPSSNATNPVGASGIIRAVFIADKDKQDANIDVLFFSQALASTLTDKAAFNPTNADLLNCIGLAQITTYSAFSGNGFGQVSGLYIPFALAAGITLTAVLVSRGTPTWTTTGSLQVGLCVEPD
jgi:hypothetical protein